VSAAHAHTHTHTHIYLPSLASPLSKPLELHITHLAHGGGRTVGDVIVEVVSHAACARGKNGI
jgi:hypothetical protein